MLPLSFGDVLPVQVTRCLLRDRGRGRRRGSSKQQDAFTHDCHFSVQCLEISGATLNGK
jgi:hypothetical protein